MKIFFTWVQQCWVSWCQPEIEIQHLFTGHKQYARLFKKSISVGADASNELILLSENGQGFEGTLILKAKQIVFLTSDGQKKNVCGKPIQVGGFSLRRVSIIWSVLPIIVAAFCLFAFVTQALQPKQEQPQLRPPVELPAKGTYGHMVEGLGQTRQVSFSFNMDALHSMTLFFSPGNIPDIETVMIEINGHVLDSLPQSINEWAREIRFAIAPQYLQIGTNQLKFVTEEYLTTPWGVRNVYIQKSHTEDQVDPAKWFRVAQKLYLERNAISGNLLRAKQAMRKSLKALKQQNKATPEPYQKLYDTIVTEQKQLFEKTLRQARLLVRNQDLVRAKIYYQKILQEMIDPMSKNRSMILQEMREARL